MICATFLLVAVACGTNAGPDNGTSTPAPALRVVTTIYPVTYFAERIGGDRVLVESLIKPGVDAHDFEPAPGDIIAIRNADVLVYTDPEFEVWIEDALNTVASDSLVVVQTANLPGDGTGSNGGDRLDPHVWLNPVQAVEQVRAIETAFATTDPDGAATYRANADLLVVELLALDSEFDAALASCALDHIVVSHEAYGHLAERYRLNQTGLSDLSAEFEPTPGRVAEIISQMRELGIGHILQEPVLSDDLAKTVARETGAEILPLHPLESLTPSQVAAGDDYFVVMRRNLESLETALECG